MNGKSNLYNLITDTIRDKANETPVGLYYNLTLLPSLEEYNRADTVNMSDNEMNKFRHIAGTKQAIKDLGIRGLNYTLGKEFYDIKNDGWKDTLYDLKNDARAIKLHLKHPNLEETELFNHVFNNYIKPFRN